MKRKRQIFIGIALLVLVSSVVIWNTWFSSTHIAFINYQGITLGQIAKANDNDRIKLTSLETDDLNRITRYDLILINGMGLRITAEQRAFIEKVANEGVAVITTMATNPANEIVSVDSAMVITIKNYLNGGGRMELSQHAHLHSSHNRR